MATSKDCPNCGSGEQFISKELASGGTDGPDFLPGLGRLLRSARLTVVVCRHCGLMRLFASAEARSKLAEASQWKRWTS